MPRGEEGAAGAGGMVLAGMDCVGGGGEPYPTLVPLWVWLGAVLGRAVPRLFSDCGWQGLILGLLAAFFYSGMQELPLKDCVPPQRSLE